MLTRWTAIAMLITVSARAEPPDTWITAQIKIATGGRILVHTELGRVTVFGKVRSRAEKEHLAELVRAVSGVTALRDLTEVEPAPPVDAEPSPPRAELSELVLSAAVKLRLVEDERIPARDISVDSSGAVVTLFGTVPTHAARAAAQADARHVTGVRRVENHLQVAPASRREIPASDLAIRRAICAALYEHNIKNVRVTVENGVVRLVGIVPSIWTQLKTSMLARYTDGVVAVRDDLHVEE